MVEWMDSHGHGVEGVVNYCLESLDEILTRAQDLGIRGHVESVHYGTPGFKEEQGAHGVMATGHGCRPSAVVQSSGMQEGKTNQDDQFSLSFRFNPFHYQYQTGCRLSRYPRSRVALQSNIDHHPWAVLYLFSRQLHLRCPH